MADMLHLVAPNGVGRASGGNVIQHVPVRAGDNGGVVFALGAALDLDTVDPGVHDVAEVINHAQIARIHDISTLFILKDGKIFPGSFFLHQRVLVAAGLRARSAVGVPAGHVVGQQAPTGIAHAHCAVAKDLELQSCGGLLSQLADFL